MSSHLTCLRVRYAETDQMGVVYYANYLVWMEVARVELCKSLGFRYRDMELDDGVLLAVVEAQCRYLYPARFDEEVIVETRVAAANSRLVSFSYEMRLADGGPQTGHRLHAPHFLQSRDETRAPAGEVFGGVRNQVEL